MWRADRQTYIQAEADKQIYIYDEMWKSEADIYRQNQCFPDSDSLAQHAECHVPAESVHMNHNLYHFLRFAEGDNLSYLYMMTNHV